ncbi:hypothetical protein [Nocardiopsis composta]|uniref:hypothetical protein n=1 Tax=Nocardiopsis composta TaxID=157465 RepID=UPI00161CFCFD|nr:hypothetical protein [Nocardiopsis composta]
MAVPIMQFFGDHVRGVALCGGDDHVEVDAVGDSGRHMDQGTPGAGMGDTANLLLSFSRVQGPDQRSARSG